MFQEERLNKILECLNQKKALSNKEIMNLFSISRDTARRDIIRLVEDGAAIRTHGGIVLSDTYKVAPYNERININTKEKVKLAKEAVKCMGKEKIFFFDTSTTVQNMCPFVKENANIYTNSLDSAFLLSEKNCNLNIIGGKFNKKNRFFYGGEAIRQIQRLNFDVAFMGACSIMEDGIYLEDSEDAFIKEIIIKRALFVILVAGGEKFYIKSKFKSFSLKYIDLLITTQTPPESIRRILEYNDTKIRIV